MPENDADPDDVPQEFDDFERYKRIDTADYDRLNSWLRDRTHITAREWAVARLCAEFRTETGVPMTKIGENLPELVPFMDEPYSPQAVNQARKSFDGKVRKAASTFLYGALCGFYTPDELDDVLYEGTEVSKFLLEVEGAEIDVDHEQSVESDVQNTMQEVRRASAELRSDRGCCPHCGEEFLVDNTGEEDG